MKIKNILIIGTLSVAVALSGCSKRVSKSTFDLPSEDNLQEWGSMLDPQYAEANAELLSTPKPSNVSPNIAITKILQALNSYDGESEFNLNTAYTVNRVNEVIIRGKKHYAGLCEFDFKKANGSDIKELKGLSPCVGIVDAEDIDKPAIIRTANAKGEPYKLVLHQESHENGFDDEYHIRKYVHNQGYKNYKTLTWEVSKPNIEFDDDFNVYFSLSWLYDDGAGGELGTAYTPVAFLLVNLQTLQIDSFSVDNPLTKNVDEGTTINEDTDYTFDQIPSWVDWVYSKRLFVQMATHYGFPIQNYGKRSFKGQLILDGTRVSDTIEVCAYAGCEGQSGLGSDSVSSDKSRTNRDIILTGFYTSRSNDLAVVSILQMNARTGKTVIFDRTGSQVGMTVRSAVQEMVQNASIMYGHYDVEDITLNPIYGTDTWQMVITRNIHDNEGNDTTTTGDSSTYYSERDISYSVYAKTCLVEASNDIKISDIICHKDNETAYILYRDHLYKKNAKSKLSTIMEDNEIEGVISQRYQLDNQIVFKLQNSKKTFIVTIDNLFDRDVGDAVSLTIGEKALFKYGDQGNLKKVPVRYVREIEM